MAIRLDPTDATAYNNRGVAHRRLGQYDRAVADYGEALRHNPDYSLAYFNRAQTYTLQGKDIEAQADVEGAVELGFDREHLDRVIDDIKRKR